MNKSLSRGLGLALVLFGMWAPQAAQAQAAGCDPATACFDLYLPPGLVGDFYLGETLVAPAVNSARLTGAPNTAYTLVARNIQEPGGVGFGDLYVYPEQSQANAQAPAGQLRAFRFYPLKNYVKGILSYTCNPRGYKATDSVACRPTIDGATVADVAAGATATYNLAGGAHTLHTDLVGDSANNWSTLARDDTVTLAAGASWAQTTRLSADFALKGLLQIILYPNALVADVLVDGAQIATQANTASLYVAAGSAHTVEAKNLKEPTGAGFGDLYTYADQSQANVLAFSAQTRLISFRPARNYVKGTLNFICDPRNFKATDSVACRPTLDGVTLADVAPNATAAYNLAPGPHTLHTELVGDSATNWSPLMRDDTVNINAGLAYLQSTMLRGTFQLKGVLKIGLWPKGLVADFYVDNGLVASQAATVDVYVASGAHTVEARAVTDPAANGQYVYGDSAQTTSVFAAGTRSVNFSPVKTWRVGFLKLTCQINGKGAADEASCAVSENGAPLGSVTAGQTGLLALAPGAHTLTFSVAGAQADKWDGPLSAPLTLFGGQTAYYTARFNLRPAPTATPVAVTPGLNHLGVPKVVLADYMLWFGPDTFDGTKTWDVPASGPYNSDDIGTIQRQVAQAQQACLDGFAAHWFGPADSRTTNNFNSLLAASAGTNLRHAIVIQTNILPGATEQTLIDAINYAINNWTQGPNYLRLGGRPLIIFTDMARPWGTEAAALAGWGRIRAATDPNHNTLWLAEGLAPTYNPLFDGLYVYRIDHRDYPQAWLKQTRWANELRAVERRGNLPIGGLYFADTIAAGFDDTRSVNAPADLRSSAPHFARDRRNGAYYAETFAATANTGGDLLFVKSFNEWIEGTEIEPGATYGDLYLNLTCQYANTYRNR